MADVSLATFRLFDKESVGSEVQVAWRGSAVAVAAEAAELGVAADAVAAGAVAAADLGDGAAVLSFTKSVVTVGG